MLSRASASFVEMATLRSSSVKPAKEGEDIERTFSVTQHDRKRRAISFEPHRS